MVFRDCGHYFCAAGVVARSLARHAADLGRLLVPFPGHDAAAAAGVHGGNRSCCTTSDSYSWRQCRGTAEDTQGTELAGRQRLQQVCLGQYFTALV